MRDGEGYRPPVKLGERLGEVGIKVRLSRAASIIDSAILH
jgi:hypothetical protein